MKRFMLQAAAAALACSVGIAAGASTKEEVTSTVVNPNTTVWRIIRPAIAQPEKNYTKIKYEEGDTIAVEAGGCDQTGGRGATWKRYVDPQGPNADRLYHGLIRLPGVTEKFKASPTGPKGLVRLSDMGMKKISTGQFKGDFFVGDLSKVPEKDRYLRLGFEDDDYDDNGYSDRDEGTDNQCKDLGTSYVVVTISHRVIHPLESSEKENPKNVEKNPAKTVVKPAPSK